MTQVSAEQVRTALGLQPHPEGGWFREVFRSDTRLAHPASGEPRSAMTVIHFLLEAGDFSAWHRVQSDELWHHAGGDPLEIHLIRPDGDGDTDTQCVRLGTDLLAGESTHRVIPAGVWQAAVPADGSAWSLATCVVAPGFDFADFFMPSRNELHAMLPRHGRLIDRFTRV